jgi:hypothetical protein
MGNSCDNYYVYEESQQLMFASKADKLTPEHIKYSFSGGGGMK